MTVKDSEGQLLAKKHEAVGWIVVSNPSKRNALSLEMWRQLRTLLRTHDADPEVRVIAITGDGDRAFCSGADLDELDRIGGKDAHMAYVDTIEPGYQAPLECTKPVVAAVRGICIGGGLGLAAACDVRLVAADAVFRMSPAKLGIGYGIAGIQRLVELVGSARTAELFFSARTLGADEAEAMGLASHVFAVAEFDRKVDEWLERVAANAPLTIAAVKHALAQLAKNPAERDLDAVASRVAHCFESEDYDEGRRAFFERRAARFLGK